jgi:AcrR family transcriptional regulator
MAERRDKTGNGRAHATLRGDVTRDRLLDAIEAIAAETGFEGLSHRVIAKRARLHSALVHYHFGTVDHLLEEAVARRAQRMSQQQRAALSALLSRGRWTVEDVVAALWEPFGSLGGTIDDGWRNYLCLVARLANNPRGDKPLDRCGRCKPRCPMRTSRRSGPACDSHARSSRTRRCCVVRAPILRSVARWTTAAS